MRLTKFKKSAAVLSAAALVALASPASAAPPYNVDVTGVGAGAHPFTAVTKAGISFVANGPLGLVNMSCAGSAVPATVPPSTVTDGPSATGLNIAGIVSTTWATPCVGPGNIPLNVTHFAGNTWRLNATGTATAAMTDNVAGYINNIDARITSKPPGLCSFRVTGRANGTFKETPKAGTTVQQLSVNENYLSGNLVISAVSGCLGFLANGNTSSFVGDYDVDVTAPAGFINITP